jgi:hypothetical protein
MLQTFVLSVFLISIQEPPVCLPQTLSQRDLGPPAHAIQFAHLHQLARDAVRLAGVKLDLPLIAHNFLDELS